MSDEESEKPLEERCTENNVIDITRGKKGSSLRTKTSHHEYKLNIRMVIDNNGSLIGYNARQETPAGPRADAVFAPSDIGRVLDLYLDPDCRIRWGIVSEPDKYPLNLECWMEFLGNKEYKRIRENYVKNGLLPCAYNSEGVTEWRRPLTDDEFYALAENLGIVEKLENQKL